MMERVVSTQSSADRPLYDEFTNMSESRGPLAAAFARQALETSRPWLPKPIKELDVLDVGSGYGHTALALGQNCRSVVGIEPAEHLIKAARKLSASAETSNVVFRREATESLKDVETFDLVILDNVYEHILHQSEALKLISRSLRSHGVLYLLVPNKLWPIEAHYRLPLLSWLPLNWANWYLRWSGRGRDYTDASYAPTYWSLAKRLDERRELSWRYVLPAVPNATVIGSPLHYRVGMSALRKWPMLWAISKALLVVAVKDA